VLSTILVPSFTQEGSSSLIVAKPDRVEVWDAESSGLVFKSQLEVWGSVVAIDQVEVKVS
jgi:DNA damage-binding protein 1